MSAKPGPDIWNSIVSKVLICNRMIIPKFLPDGTEMPHPTESGLFRKSVGERKGQVADWRASVSGSDRGVHVVEFRNCYSIHVDQYDPYKKPVEHIIYDSPRTGAALAIAGLGILTAARVLSRARRKKL
ncbi:hypothetical protein IX51_05355 [uncultured archaeon]|nr:hypothetical protein IX51_05355 [uncultured archaeon]